VVLTTLRTPFSSTSPYRMTPDPAPPTGERNRKRRPLGTPPQGNFRFCGGQLDARMEHSAAPAGGRARAAGTVPPAARLPRRARCRPVPVAPLGYGGACSHIPGSGGSSQRSSSSEAQQRTGCCHPAITAGAGASHGVATPGGRPDRAAPPHHVDPSAPQVRPGRRSGPPPCRLPTMSARCRGRDLMPLSWADVEPVLRRRPRRCSR
jgi:hypothetical protein